MAEQADSPVLDPGLAKAREASGIMDGTKDPSLDIENEAKPADDAQAAVREKLKPKPDAEANSDDNSDDEESEDADDEETDEEGEESAADKSAATPPAKKKSSPIKAAFTQIGELRSAIADLTKLVGESVKANSAKPGSDAAVAAKSIDDTITDLLKEAEDKGGDAEFFKKFGTTLVEKVKQDLADKGLLTKDLPKDVQERLKLLDTIEVERDDQREVQSFGTEWSGLLPALKQRYPNASDALLRQAQDEMFNIATSEEGGKVLKKAKTNDKGEVVERGRISPYPLDYLLYKFTTKFDAILKVAKGTKQAEGGSHEIDNGKENEGSASEDIDMPLDNQGPDTYKRIQAQKLRDSEPEPVRVMNV